ncbi:MAG: zinc-ribbon domain-containing protein [Eubacterium sp.]|nr:zinc-ribbon domain-containing protein [Eubacterium sp.]
MFCIHCGKQIENDSKFCIYCGNKQVDVRVNHNNYASSANNQQATSGQNNQQFRGQMNQQTVSPQNNPQVFRQISQQTGPAQANQQFFGQMSQQQVYSQNNQQVYGQNNPQFFGQMNQQQVYGQNNPQLFGQQYSGQAPVNARRNTTPPVPPKKKASHLPLIISISSLVVIAAVIGVIFLLKGNDDKNSNKADNSSNQNVAVNTETHTSDVKTTAAPSDIKTTESTASDVKTTESTASDVKTTESTSSDVKTTESAASDDKTTAATSESVTDPYAQPSDNGKVLNIYCWNDEFKNRLTAYYPSYKYVDETHGRIGDVEVVWTIIPSTDYAYRKTLDNSFVALDSMDADSRPDIILLEDSYAALYTDSDFTMDISKLGINYSELSDQFSYTHEIMKDSFGNLKALTWQTCPGVLIYNREIAKLVFGSDEPNYIQTQVCTWDKYMEAAQTIRSKGYNMTVSVFETYRAFSQQRTTPWVVNAKINIDDQLVKWVNMSKMFYDSGISGTADLWSTEWYNGFYQDRDYPFCYFGPAWFYEYCMESYVETSIAANGGWGVVPGPAPFYWGGTYIAAVNGTDNKSLVADIMRTLTIDTSTAARYQAEVGDIPNSKTVMTSNAYDDTFSSTILGGQNPDEYFAENANNINPPAPTIYDEACDEEFQEAMQSYFEGYYTYDEALNIFYNRICEKYPELSR